MKTPSELKKWAETRKRGRMYFAITRGVLGFGLPIVVILLIYELGFKNGPNRYNIYEIGGQFGILIPGLLLGGYWFGRKLWNQQEKEYLEAYPDKPPPKIESQTD